MINTVPATTPPKPSTANPPLTSGGLLGRCMRSTPATMMFSVMALRPIKTMPPATRPLPVGGASIGHTGVSGTGGGGGGRKDWGDGSVGGGGTTIARGGGGSMSTGANVSFGGTPSTSNARARVDTSTF